MSLGSFGKIAVGWAIITVGGVYAFVVSKNSVDKRRYESMQIRERMRKANIDMAALPQLEPAEQAKLQMMQEMEIEMMSDLYNRMTNACHKKCIPPRYGDSELGKGEMVCIDRCVAKYLDIHEKIGKKLTAMSIQDEELMKKMSG